MLRHQASYLILPSDDSTLAIEVCKSGLTRRKKHLFFLERFGGELTCTGDEPEPSDIRIEIDPTSLVCRDKSLRPKAQEQISRYAQDILAIDRHAEIKFKSSSVSRKAIRGFAVEGILKIRDTSRTVKANIVVNQTKPERLQIDGDAMFRLSEFGINPPSSFFGLVRIKDEVLIRLLLWATLPGN